MRIFISGGCKNGKSVYAQRLAMDCTAVPRYYIATMKPADDEDAARIRRHRDERRGCGFITVEQPVNIEKILADCNPRGSFLLDSLTALLANEMFRKDGKTDPDAPERIISGLNAVLDRIENIVIVSDYIYSDAAVYDALTEGYRKALAKIDRAAAARCESVLEVAFSGVFEHKGKKGAPH